jgi:HPt (histidine-containing phosphotransfer) domain-containing protein
MCKAHGLNHYVSKPFEPEQFIAVVLTVLNGKKPAAPLPGEAAAPAPSAAESQPASTPEPAAESQPSSSPAPAAAADTLTPVLDVQAGLRLIGGDEEIYRMILKEYYGENSGVAAALKDSIDAGDYADAVQIVHKTKSSSGNIGAKRLYESASELQKALQNNEAASIPGMHAEFRKLFLQLQSEIKDMLGL